MAYVNIGVWEALRGGETSIPFQFENADGSHPDLTGATGKCRVKTSETAASEEAECTIDSTKSNLADAYVVFTFGPDVSGGELDFDAGYYHLGAEVKELGKSTAHVAVAIFHLKQNVTDIT